jgi:hypothetical protein
MDPYTEAVIWYKHPLSFVHVGTILHHLVDVAGLRTRLQVAHEICQRYLARTAKRREDIYDARVRLKNYQPGDAVWYLHEQRKEGVCTKLQPLYMDPCVVLKKYKQFGNMLKLNG